MKRQNGYAEVGVIFLVAIACALLMSGCSMRASMSEHAELSGSPVALRALMDGMIGMQKTAKEAPDAHSEFFAHRGAEEREITARSKGSFLDGLFGKNAEGGK